jgi:Flp pilus assembly protein CpaB
LKRSNRLVLLVGVFLAIVAFVLIAILLSSNKTNSPTASTAPTTVSFVIAANDIPLGATIQQADLTTKDYPTNQKPSNGYTDVSFVIGQIARSKVTAGQLITTDVLNANGKIDNLEVPPGLVGIAVQVDQISGVGTIIKPGDFVDVISGFTGADNVPLVVPAPVPSNAPANAPVQYIKVEDNIYNHATVKALAQGLQVLGTLLPPPTQAEAQATPTPGPSGAPANNGNNGNGTTLNGQQQIVILAATPQQAELIKFTQMSGSITLVLRSPEDCTAAPGASAEPSASTEPTEPGQYCPVIATTGVTLRRAVDDNGVLPPQVVQVLIPSPLPGSVVRR